METSNANVTETDSSRSQKNRETHYYVLDKQNNTLTKKLIMCPNVDDLSKIAHS